MRGQVWQRQVWRFGLIGALGFLVDTGLLTVFMAAGLDPYLARCLSLPMAIFCTWLGNRWFTFRVQRMAHTGPGRELLSYTLAMLAGAFVNYALYAGLVALGGLFRSWPVLAVLVATTLSMGLNFFSARRILAR